MTPVSSSPTSTTPVVFTAEARANIVCEYLDQIARNINNLPAVAFLLGALAALPQADGGPLLYASCVAGCEALATVATGGPGAAFIGQCIQACLPTFYLPTP